MLKINEVFTPRRSEVNENMYAKRPSLEKKLLRSLEGSMHSLLFGESGNGKSWLYKHVLSINKIPHVIVNAGTASRLGSITQEIFNAIVDSGTSTKTGYSEDKKAKLSAVFAEAEVVHQDQFQVSKDEPLLAAFKVMEKKYPKTKHILVIDNLESILNSEILMSELADIILLLDDSRYAPYNMKLLIVGLPLDIFEYFSKTKNVESIANRLMELPKVQGLLMEQVEIVVEHGFNKLLRFQLSEPHLLLISKDVFNITMGIAQKVHEFCELLAYEIEDNNGKFSIPMLDKVQEQWLLAGLYQAYKIIESNLNIRPREISRKNQVIYIIGLLTVHQFDAAKIENEVRARFSKTIAENMGIPKILNSLSSGTTPILRQNSKTHEYSLLDPRYAMCIRMMLHSNDGKIVKKQFKRY